MKTALMLCLAALLSTGCDYRTPLVTQPELAMDEALAGLWQGPETDGASQILLLLPWNDREYLVVYPAGTENAMFAKGCLWQGDEIRLVQLHWIGAVRDGLAGEPRAYQFAAYKLQDQKLTVKLINPELVPKTAGTADELIRAITEHRTDPNLFRDPMLFRRQPI